MSSLSMTYKEVAEAFLDADDGNTELQDCTKGIIAFAEHLDSQNVLTHQLEILALMQVRKVDREFMELLIQEVGTDKAKELALIIHQRHKRCPNQSEVQNLSEDKNSEEGKSETL